MGEQLSFSMKPMRGEPVRFDAGLPINWRRADRRARRLLAEMVEVIGPAALHDGFALRRYTDNAALLEILRRELTGRRLKQAVRGSGRMPVKSTVLFAISREGRCLHALVDQVEERLRMQEAGTLCG